MKEGNPFYCNYLWREEDISRCIFNKWHRVWLWLYPTLTQIDDGRVFFFKLARGKYWFIGASEIKMNRKGSYGFYERLK